ncbi:MAG: alanine:cation symporter family protein, partial [Clostridia bacterium]|nr:alanine:cation symporter family protein [Clostridia bacterium]
PSKAAWALADISMGGMTMINIPACVILGGTVFKALRDYEAQKKANKNPIFFTKEIGLNQDDFDFWKEDDTSHIPEEVIKEA